MIPEDAAIAAAMLERLSALPPGRSLDPAEFARALAGPDETVWRRLMTPIRRVATRLARSGEATLMRKGKPVDPAEIRGLYRIARAGGPA